MRSRLFAAHIGFWLIVTPAHAQYTGSFDLVQWGSVDAGHEAAIAESVADTVSAPPPAVRSSKSPASKNLGFVASEKRRQQTLQAMVQRVRRSDPAGAAQLEQFLATPDMFGLLDGALAPMGLKTTNLADAFAIWWIAAWNGSRGENDTTDRATAQAVKRQAEAALLSTPGIADLTDAQKQELAESYLIQLALIDASIEWGKANPAGMEQVRRAIAQGAKASGMDLSKVTLTEEGFVPASRTTGANDAGVPDPAEPVAVAASDGSALSPLLYAGAGAGVAALVFWAACGRG